MSHVGQRIDFRSNVPPGTKNRLQQRIRNRIYEVGRLAKAFGLRIGRGPEIDHIGVRD